MSKRLATPLASVNACSPAARGASQRRKSRQRASVRKALCRTLSSGQRLVSRQASLKRRLTRGTLHSLQTGAQPAWHAIQYNRHSELARL